MKLTELFSRARNRAASDELSPPTARAGKEAADRSSMADLVRLLKEADDAQPGSKPRPA